MPRRYAGSSAQERSEQRRERLLEAALDVFGRNGYANTTMRLICANARMTDRYFYECFASLDEVFKAVHERLSAELGMQIAASMSSSAPSDPIAVVRGALAVFFDYIKADPRRARILLLDAMSFGLTSTEVAKTRLDWYAGLIEARVKARYPNLPPHLDFNLVASGFVGQVTYIAIVWTLQKFDTPIEQLVDHAAYGWMGFHQWLSHYDASVPVRSSG